MRTLLVACLLAGAALAQEQPQPPAAQPTAPGQQPPVRVTYLNVCSPSEEEKKELSAALARVPLQPAFAIDFEVSRGRSGAAEGLAARLAGGEVPPSTWVRLRRDFAGGYFSTAQYSVTRDDNGLAEVLVFRVRDPKDLMQISISDSVTGTTDAATLLATDTPPSRVKLERFGRSSVALQRCPGGDQAKYEDVFQAAARVMRAYRDRLGARRTVPAEFARLGAPRRKAPAPPAAAPPKPQQQKP